MIFRGRHVPFFMHEVKIAMCGKTNERHGHAGGSAEMTGGRGCARGSAGAPAPRHSAGSQGETPEQVQCLAPVTQAHGTILSHCDGFMVDWLTLRLDMSEVCEEARDRLESLTGRMLRIDPRGEVLWEVGSRESISDGNGQVTVSVGSDLIIQGSPARAYGQDNVFGSGDILQCADRMVTVVERAATVTLPRQWERWKVTRVDVAANYDFGSFENVRAGLQELKHVEGGKYQVKTAAETVYWSQGSRVRSGKCYAKGPELRRRVRLGDVQLDGSHLDMTDRLVRLELKLGAQYMRERADRPWSRMDSEYLEHAHRGYFEQFTGNMGVEVNDDGGLEQALIRQAVEQGRSEAVGRSAYLTWRLIVAEGVEQVKVRMSRSSWTRRKRQLLDAGLTWGNFQRREVAGFRSRRFTFAEPVRSWADLESRCV